MSQQTESVEGLVARIEEQWRALEVQISRYPADVLTGPADDAGWTIRDHLAHLTAWEGSVLGIVRDARPQNETMGVDRALWDADDLDAINERIRAQTANDSIAKVLETRETTHRDLLAALDAVSVERLRQRWTDGVGDASEAPTILEKVIGNTVEHYPEHGEWIAAIAAGRSDAN